MGADFYHVVKMMRERLGTNAVPIQLPIGKEDVFKGFIDLITNEAIVYTDDLGTKAEGVAIPDDMKELAVEYRTKMLESVAETDEGLMMKYLEGEEFTLEEVKVALRNATIAGEIVPVICGSSYKNKGVQPMLDAVVDYLPSPVDIGEVKGIDPDTDEEITRDATDEAPFAALAFKIMTDPFVGRLAFARVYSGVITAGSYVLNSSKNKRERLGRIVQNAC